jgi:predicted aldo/keto reductase-like oxidoreductase
VRCRKCESHCPQGIVISEEIQKAAKRLEPFWFKPGFALARKVLGVKGQ